MFADMNKHILDGVLPCKVSCLSLQEATHLHWDGHAPQTHINRDGKPIDKVYHTPDLVITAFLQILFHEGTGDLVDVSTSSAIGKFKLCVVHPKARRLVTRNKA
jgi:hypothetical protein